MQLFLTKKPTLIEVWVEYFCSQKRECRDKSYGFLGFSHIGCYNSFVVVTIGFVDGNNGISKKPWQTFVLKS